MKLNRNSNIFIEENTFENVVCEIASICLGLNVLTHLEPLRMKGYHSSIYLRSVHTEGFSSTRPLSLYVSMGMLFVFAKNATKKFIGIKIIISNSSQMHNVSLMIFTIYLIFT